MPIQPTTALFAPPTTESISPHAPGAPSVKDYFAAPRPPLLQRPPMTAAEEFPRAFGVELEMAETTLPAVSRVLQRALPGAHRQKSTHTPYDVFDIHNRRWEVKKDYPNVEVTTPILRTRQDLALLQKVVASLAAAGMKCDEGTGVHVHVDAKQIAAPELTYLLALVTRHEPYVFSALQVNPTRRRDDCRPLALARVNRAVRAEPQTLAELQEVFRNDLREKRCVGLNLERIFDGSFGTVEFRYFNGCLEPHAIGCYVGYAVALLQHVSTEPQTVAPAGTATLPGLLSTVGLTPAHPASRFFCNALRRSLENKISSTPRLAELVRSQNYSGDAAMMLALDANPADLERALTSVADAPLFFAEAATLLRYVPLDVTAKTFRDLLSVPAQERPALLEQACKLLDNPRFACHEYTIFRRLRSVPHAKRAEWVNTALKAPVAAVVHFAQHNTLPLARAFGMMGMRHTTFPGTYQLAEKVLACYADGAPAVRERIKAALTTLCMPGIDAHMHGRLMSALFDLTPAQMRELAGLSQRGLAQVKHLPEIYTCFVEALCQADPQSWPAQTARMHEVLTGRESVEVLRGLHTGLVIVEKLLEDLEPVRLLDGSYVPSSRSGSSSEGTVWSGSPTSSEGVASSDGHASDDSMKSPFSA